ncbi:MAG: hypothetical protein ACJAXW_004263 [Candidatus Azotimanducaceae bacterium]|jgi:hypothetical protein
MFKPTAVALYTKKTMLEHSASKVTTEFIVNESWQRNVRIGKMGLK